MSRKSPCVHGDEKLYPTAEIYLTAGGQTFLLPVVLVPQLPYSVVLGRDVPILLDLLQQPKPCNLVTTRTQSIAEGFKELPFYDTELETSPVKKIKTRSQKRREKFLGGLIPPAALGSK